MAKYYGLFIGQEQYRNQQIDVFISLYLKLENTREKIQ